jgi:ketosteroid isomerase-like protein
MLPWQHNQDRVVFTVARRGCRKLGRPPGSRQDKVLGCWSTMYRGVGRQLLRSSFHLPRRCRLPRFINITVLAFLLTSGAVAHGMKLPSATATNSVDSEADSIKLLDRFADAWNRHDVDALMSMMTDDGVFEASGGSQVDGQRSEGKQAVRAAYAAVFDTYPDAHWANPKYFVVGNRGVSEWTFTGTQKDGKRVEVTGCDLFTFRGGKIAIKNSYRKNRPPI